MSKLVFGDRVGKSASLSPGASAIIYNSETTKVLLTRRSDNGRWCLPGGGMDPGESASECCAREVLEETGLVVSVGRLVGVYTSPHLIVEYADGNRIQPVAFSFEAKPICGKLTISDETTEYGFFSLEEMKTMDLMEHHHQRIIDAEQGSTDTLVR